MSSKKKILATTATRADYDLLSYVYKELSRSPLVDFRILVSGTHLSTKHGNSVDEIKKDGLKILARLPNLIEEDSRSARIRTAATLMSQATPLISEFAPDLILYAGDREDAIVTALMAAYLKIPGIHFFGGDHAADGNVDNPVRHATSKLSTAHFVACEPHAERLKSIGESEKRIFTVGSPSIDKLIREKQLTKTQILKALNIELLQDKKYAVLTFHAMYGEEKNAGNQMKAIIEVLLEKDYFIFCNSPNIDAGFDQIFGEIETYSNNPNFIFFKNLSREYFVNLMRNSDLMIGNSSGGILEAATLRIPVVNVGKRQLGRIHGGNVIFCETNQASIRGAIDQTLSSEYIQLIANLKNPYGDGNSSIRIVELLNKVNYASMLFKDEDPLLMSSFWQGKSQND